MLALLPDAEELLSIVRGIRADLVRPLPAHASLLYPGPTPQTSSHQLRDLAQPVPEYADLTATLTSDEGFVGVSVPQLDPIAQQLRARFPALTPYGGRYGNAPAAHLTVALGATSAELSSIQRSIDDVLPLRSQVLGPHFVEYSQHGWQVIDGSP